MGLWPADHILDLANGDVLVAGGVSVTGEDDGEVAEAHKRLVSAYEKHGAGGSLIAGVCVCVGRLRGGGGGGLARPLVGVVLAGLHTVTMRMPQW